MKSLCLHPFYICYQIRKIYTDILHIKPVPKCAKIYLFLGTAQNILEYSKRNVEQFREKTSDCHCHHQPPSVRPYSSHLLFLKR